MLASSHTDPLLGVDIHWEFIPTPAPTPTPLPNPFTGIVFDPLGLAVGVALGAAMSAALGTPFQGPVIYWGAFPATNTGTEGIHVPGHILIPPGTGWAPIPRTPKPVIRPGETPDPPKPISPDNDAIAIFGSKTVSVMGSNAVRLGDIFMSCSEPVRLPSSVVMAIPKGAPILIGGPPSLDIMAAILASLRTRFMSDSLHALVSRLNPGRFRNFLHRAVCFLTGHPVDVASGKVLTEFVDAALPGPLPLQLDRIYSSAWANRDSCFGHGWCSSLDQVVWRERGKVVLRSDDGREIEFDTFDLPGHRIEPGQSVCNRFERLTLRCLPGEVWEVESPSGVVRRFRPVERAPELGPHPLHPRAALGPVAAIESVHTRHYAGRIQFFYDARGYLEWVRDASGRTLGFVHDHRGHTTAIHLPKAQGEGLALHRTYTYDEHGDLVAVEDALGQRWTFAYVTHLLTRETDRTGASYYFAYDGYGADGWCTRTWGDDGTFDHVLVYDKNQHRTWVTDSLGHTTEYQMNVAGMVTKVIDALGNETQYVYDPETLRRVETIEPGGHVTRVRYDERGNPCEREHPDGARLQVRFNDGNDPVEAIDANGGVWTWDYDHAGRVVATQNPLEERTTYGYDDTHARVGTNARDPVLRGTGLPAWARGPGGRTVAFEHDAHGNIATIKNSAGREVQFRFDNRGRRTRIHEVGGTKLSLHYDAEGRLVELSRPSGERQRRSYDAEGRLVKVEDADRRVELRYSAVGGAGARVVARIESGETERFEYDSEGRLCVHVDPQGRRHEFERDALGRVIVEHPAGGVARRVRYDARGFVSKIASDDGRELEIGYDPRGRVTDIERSDGSFSRFRYRLDGSMLEALNECSSMSFERDALGRILREQVGDDWVASRYDIEGDRVAVASSIGLDVGLEHGPSGAVSRLQLELASWADANIAFERDASGRELTRYLPGDIALRWARDERSRPVQRHTYKTRACADKTSREIEQVLEDRRWHWRGEDRLVAVEDATRAGVTHYRYDAHGRVTAEQGRDRSLARAHDLAGNVYRRTDRLDREYADDGRLLRTSSARYGYDDAGQRIERQELDPSADSIAESDPPTWRFGYDDRGMLRAVVRPDGRRIEYDYDALGRRVHKRRLELNDDGEPVACEEEVRYVWDGQRLIHELRESEDPITWYWTPHDAAPVAKRRGDRLWSIIADHMGNPTEMYDESGRLSWQSELDIFGRAHLRVGEAGDCPWRWPGQYEDVDAELYYNGFRYYDPETGTYTARDPLGLIGSPCPYAYPGNPWAWTDPLGLMQDYMGFLNAANAWNAGEGASTPMSQGFIGQTWGLYQRTYHGSGVPVIGDFGDVARYIDNAGPNSNFAKLLLPMPPSTGFHWNTFVNDQWMQAFIDRRSVVMLASEPTEDLLNSAEFGRSVFGREMDQLTDAGYRLLGKLGDPDDPLRMEPPCK